jgi:predicted transcriptional regulator
MVRSQNLPRPTDAELEILQVLWHLKSGTVRQILKTINQHRQNKAGYTTILKLLQIMTEKGLVERDITERPQIYRARLPQEQTQRQLMRDLVERAFEGSPAKLVLQALSDKKTTAEELTHIRQLLDRVERGVK